MATIDWSKKKTVAMKEEEAHQQKISQAAYESDQIILEALKKAQYETGTFTKAEISKFSLGHKFDEWTPGVTYKQGKRIQYKEIAYEVKQPSVTAIASQPPNLEGMLAVYAPISSKGSGTLEDPFEFIYGIYVDEGEYYTYNDKLWHAAGDMHPCTWYPGTPGLWQWEEVTNE